MHRDPNQTFAIKSITRSDIASDCNTYIEDSCNDGCENCFSCDDERLTDDICQEYATWMGNLLGSNDYDENLDVAIRNVLERTGYFKDVE